MIIVGLFQLKFYSILFYSILFYSILFYSILFYSILFYSILLYSTLSHHLASIKAQDMRTVIPLSEISSQPQRTLAQQLLPYRYCLGIFGFWLQKRGVSWKTEDEGQGLLQNKKVGLVLNKGAQW